MLSQSRRLNPVSGHAPNSSATAPEGTVMPNEMHMRNVVDGFWLPDSQPKQCIDASPLVAGRRGGGRRPALAPRGGGGMWET